jgi:DNA-binding response OmpR family regulator
MTRRSATAEQRVGGEQLLLVDGDPELGPAIVEQLIADGYRAELARTAEHARVRARAGAPSLVVLGDLDLDPPRGALELLEEIRKGHRADTPWEPDTPVIVIGSRARKLDMLRAFELGADDYLARPAEYLELRARLRAVLRRAGSTGRDRRAFRVGALAIDTGARSVTLDGQAVDLRRQEFELLVHLACEPRRVFRKDELLRALWGYRSSGTTRTLDSHASRLRRKLDLDGSRRWVVNVWGVGYRLI